MPDYAGEVVKHCAKIDECNQRGGRMLSVPDLVEAGTISVLQAAFFMKHICEGASFIVGAKPGGAGKTTVMCALLNFLPLETEIIHTENAEVLKNPPEKKPACFLCHEIGAGRFYSYLWGAPLTDFFRLKKQGHIIVSNLHADTYLAAKEEICMDNPVPEELFNNLDMLAFMEVSGNRRHVSKIYLKNAGKHTLFNDRDMTEHELLPYVEFIEDSIDKRIRLMRDFRKAVVDFLT